MVYLVYSIETNELLDILPFDENEKDKYLKSHKNVVIVKSAESDIFTEFEE
jgi:hypothetical protein